ncbi:MAG: purine-cytosine permease family protein [Actinomycetota bacterium]
MDSLTTPTVAPEAAEEARLDETQRSGSPRSLAATWAGVLLAPGTIITGMVAAGGSAGPGFAIGFAGLAFGTILGTLAVGFISIWGPRTGMAQMPLGRLAFGALNVVPQIFLIGSLIAYNALNDLFGVDALATSLGIPFLVALAAVVAIEVTVVIVGVRLMRILGTVISAVMLLISIGLIIGAAQVPPAPAPPGVEGFPMGPFLLAVGLGLSGSISWTVQACDLSRVLPARTSPVGVFAWVFVGMTVPLLVLGGIGAWVSTNAALDDPMARVDELLGGGAIATVALVALGTSLATANAFNDFSAGLSLKQMGLRFPRAVCSLFVTAAGLTLALISRNTQLGQLTSDIVLFAGYYTAPWFGVVIVELLYRWGEPRPWETIAEKTRAAVAAFLIGFILLLPFTATPLGNQIAADYPIALGWLGWVSRNLLDGGDGAYLAGAVFGAVLYGLFRRIGRTSNTVTVSSSG